MKRGILAIKDIVEIDKNANDSNSSDTNDNDANIAIKAEVLILKHNWKRPKLRQQEYDARNRYFSRIVLMVSDCNKIRIAFIFFNCCKAIYPKIVLLFFSICKSQPHGLNFLQWVEKKYGRPSGFMTGRLISWRTF